ncbi:MAG: transposase [Verrucomicrobiota bacterium]
MQLLTTDASSSLAEGFRLLLNEAMARERSAVLQAQPYERCEGRLGSANGFKPRFLNTRVGPVELRIPQVRDGVSFYPSALEKRRPQRAGSHARHDRTDRREIASRKAAPQG